jgi:hypothetical protein
MTFDNILDSVISLPTEQQISLIYIVKKRLSENRREEIANDAKVSIEDFHNGMFQSETADNLIKRLNNSQSVEE